MSSPPRWTPRPACDPAGSRAVASALIAGLRVYRALVSPLLPRSCRFAPSCSEFATEAVREHGASAGLRLSLGRIARCHPWNPGGYDPVPRAGKE